MPFTTVIIEHHTTIKIFGIRITSWIWLSRKPELIIRCGLVIYPPPVTINLSYPARSDDLDNKKNYVKSLPTSGLINYIDYKKTCIYNI